MIISKTPLRVSFAGGGSDLRSYYKDNKYGAVLSTSIDSYIYVSIKKQPSLFKEKYRLNYSETELVDNLDQIKNPIIRECLRLQGYPDSFKMVGSKSQSYKQIGNSVTVAVIDHLTKEILKNL